MAAGTGRVAYSNSDADHRESAGDTWFVMSNSAYTDITNNTSVLSLDLRENVVRGNFQIGLLGVRCYYSVFSFDDRRGYRRDFWERYGQLRHKREIDDRVFQAKYKTNLCDVKAGFSRSAKNFDWGEVTHKSFSKNSVAVRTRKVPMLTLNIEVAGEKSRKNTATWNRGDTNWVVLNKAFEAELKERWNSNKGKNSKPKGKKVSDLMFQDIKKNLTSSKTGLDETALWQSEELINKNGGNIEDFAPLALLKSLPKYQQEQRYVENMEHFIDDMNMTIDGMEMGVPLTKKPMAPKDLFDNGGGIVVNAFDNGRQTFNFTQDGWRNFTFGPATFYWFNRQVHAYIGGRSVKAEDDFLLVRGPAVWHFECLGERLKDEQGKPDSDGQRKRENKKSVFTQRFEGGMHMESVDYSNAKSKEGKKTIHSIKMISGKDDTDEQSMPLFEFRSPVFKFASNDKSKDDKFELNFNADTGVIEFRSKILELFGETTSTKGKILTEEVDSKTVKVTKAMCIKSNVVNFQ